jgi:diguanylate cyclase (GGDEF)-like protein/PAS domain S-box-containing protein
LEEVADSSSALFWEVDAATGEFTSISGRVEEVLGYSAEDLPACLADLIVEENQGRWWVSVLDNKDDDFVLECRTTHRDGHIVWLRMSVRRMSLRNKHLLRGIALDITELVAIHEEVRRRAEVDDLTQLPNRFVLVRELGKMVVKGGNFALFVLDLDRFKDINDTLGHHAGDDYLVEMARRLASSAGDEGLVARVGGDEFAVVVEMTAGMDRVMELADRLMAVCEVPVEVGGPDFSGSASCGIAIAPLHGNTVEDLLRRADLAMYAAQRTGASSHLFESASDEAKVSRLKLTAEAEPALSSGQMKLWFQPKMDLASGRLVGAEGLLRWHHPERGVLVPSHFLDILELTRHRRQLCEQVIHQGVAFIARAHSLGVNISTAVNVSIRDLLDEDLPSRIVHELDSYGVSPELLTLEVTERELMDDRTGFAQAAAAVRSAGVELSIDDFGTGHSSLLRLHQLPVNELKIDRSFVSGLGSDPEAEIIVGSIIELGNALGHRIVAEGIERQHEVAVLRRLGCRIGQGYLYSPALPVEDFFEALCGIDAERAESEEWGLDADTSTPY